MLSFWLKRYPLYFVVEERISQLDIGNHEPINVDNAFVNSPAVRVAKPEQH